MGLFPKLLLLFEKESHFFKKHIIIQILRWEPANRSPSKRKTSNSTFPVNFPTPLPKKFSNPITPFSTTTPQLVKNNPSSKTTPSTPTTTTSSSASAASSKNDSLATYFLPKSKFSMMNMNLTNVTNSSKEKNKP